MDIKQVRRPLAKTWSRWAEHGPRRQDALLLEHVPVVGLNRIRRRRLLFPELFDGAAAR